MRTILITSLFAGLALWSCTPEEKPSGDASFDVNLEIPAEIVLETNAKSIEFNVIDGKAPKSSDLIILDGPAGQKFCQIQSVSSAKVKIDLYSGFKEGQHGLNTVFLTQKYHWKICVQSGKVRELSDEVSHHRLLLCWRLDTGSAASLDTTKHPSHVSAKLSHDLHSFLILTNLVRSIAMYHIPIL